MNSASKPFPLHFSVSDFQFSAFTLRPHQSRKPELRPHPLGPATARTSRHPQRHRHHPDADTAFRQQREATQITPPFPPDAIRSLPVLEIDDETIKQGAKILKSGIIPQKAAADAGHVAVAARHGIDYLLTWNCKHIANAEIIRRLDQVIRDQGYLAPIICTPTELFGSHDHE